MGKQIQELQALVRQQKTFASAPAHRGWVALDTLRDVTTSASAVAWTTFDCSSFVPLGATWVKLQVSAVIDDTTVGTVHVRRDQDGAELILTEGGIAAEAVKRRRGAQADCPLSGDRSFQYEVEGGFDSLTIQLLAYYLP